MATLRISVDYSITSELTAGNNSSKSISPFTLRQALTAGSLYGINVQAVTATNFQGDGSRLSNVISNISFSTLVSQGVTLSASNIAGILTLSARNIICPPWHVGLTKQPLYSETGTNRKSLQAHLVDDLFNYRNYMQQVNVPILSAEYVLTPTGAATISTGASNEFGACCRLSDGRVYIIPDTGRIARIYDPITDTLTTPPGIFPFDNGQYIGLLLPDGRVCCTGNTIRLYNPSTNTFITPTGTAGSFFGAYPFYIYSNLLPDGRVFLSPANAPIARIYDPATDILTTPAGTYPGGDAHGGSVLLRDGRVYLVPRSSACARIYDPVANTLTTPAGIFSTGTANVFIFNAGVLLNDGRVFMPPFLGSGYTAGPGISGTNLARIYDPVTNTLTTPNIRFAGGTGLISARSIPLPDGRVLITSFETCYTIYDPITDTLSTPSGLPIGSRTRFTSMINNNRIFTSENGETFARILVLPSLNVAPSKYAGDGLFFKDCD